MSSPTQPEDWEDVEAALLGPVVHYAQDPEKCAHARGKRLPLMTGLRRVPNVACVSWVMCEVTCPLCRDNLTHRRGQWR